MPVRGNAGQPTDRGDLDDPPRALLAHDRQRRLRNPQRSEEVDFELAASLLFGKLLDRARDAIPRVVDDDVQAPEALIERF